jgi:Kef-type K+ transport system membrane component KefB
VEAHFEPRGTTAVTMSILASLRRLEEGGGHGGGHELLYILLFWIAAYVADFAAQKTRLSPLLFYLLFGVCFSNFGITEKSLFMQVFAEVAITLVFFALGFEENVEHFLGGIKKAWGIAILGAFVPFLCGFGCSNYFWPEEGFKSAMMVGLAVTATAVSLTMITLKSKGLERSNAAIGIMTSAVLDDVMSLILVAIMVPIASGEADPSVEGILLILGKTAGFFLLISLLHLVIFPHDLSTVPILKHIPFLRSMGVNNLVRFHDGEQAVLVALAIGLGLGLVAEIFGFHPAIGAYMAGLILEKDYFEMPECDEKEAHNIYEHVKEILENAAYVWLGPIFFIQLGTDINIDIEIVKNVVPETLTLFFSLFFGQIFSAAFAARYIPGGFDWAESFMIGFGMLGRAELFFVVLNICYNEYPIYSTEMFYSLTFAAVLLNISVPVTISLYTPYYLGEKSLFGKGARESQGGTQLTPTNSAVALQEQFNRRTTDASAQIYCCGMPYRSRFDKRRGF